MTKEDTANTVFLSVSRYYTCIPLGGESLAQGTESCLQMKQLTTRLKDKSNTLLLIPGKTCCSEVICVI